MGKHYNFVNLRLHATKIHKFTQAKSLARLDPSKANHGDAINDVKFSEQEFDEVKGGICAALSSDWLREKLTSDGNKSYAGASGSEDLHGGLNLGTTLRNVPPFLVYRDNNGAPTAAKILAQYELAPSKKAASLDPMARKNVLGVERSRRSDGSTYEKPTVFTVTDFLASMINGCKPEILTKGRGAYISFRVERTESRGGGHAVAAYRSRGNNLYFFDSNCGVYDIVDLDGFFAAYVDCYADLKCTLSFSERDGFVYLDR